MSHLIAREEEILRLLEVVHSRNLECVVIGGYAVDAYTVHRYSVDLDLLVSDRGLGEAETLLSAEGFNVKGRGRLMHEYVKKVLSNDVSVELFVGELTCRQTEASWSYDLSKRNAASRRIVGMMSSTQSLVPRRELLMAMKLHSSRAPDLRDVVMLSEDVDWESVARFAETGVKEKMLRQLDSATKTISKTEFASAVRSEFGIATRAPLPIARTLAGIARIKNYLLNP